MDARVPIPFPNASKIGAPNSRWDLLTPALVLDADALEHNITVMARRAKAFGIGLRPHAKTHKSAHIARLQLEAGAVGVCVAKLGEAEALLREDIDRILITSPIVNDEKMQTLLNLDEQAHTLMTVVDHPEVTARLGAAAHQRGRTLKILVDLGMGRNRTGVATPEGAGALAAAVTRTPGLEFCGLQAYAGHVQHIEDAAKRLEVTQAQLDRISAAAEAMRTAGCPPRIVTGGGTGSHLIDGPSGVFTDLQFGSYIFMDVEYLRVAELMPADDPFHTSLFVQSTVISVNGQARATTDAGFKSFAMDGPRPTIARGAPQGASYDFMGDEHGCVVLPEGAEPMAPGDTVVCVTPHCDPTVNLYDAYHVVRGDRLVDIWPVHSRGASW